MLVLLPAHVEAQCLKSWIMPLMTLSMALFLWTSFLQVQQLRLPALEWDKFEFELRFDHLLAVCLWTKNLSEPLYPHL